MPKDIKEFLKEEYGCKFCKSHLANNMPCNFNKIGKCTPVTLEKWSVHKNRVLSQLL